MREKVEKVVRKREHVRENVAKVLGKKEKGGRNKKSKMTHCLEKKRK